MIVAINAFPTDTPAEHEAIREVALAAGARDAVVTTNWAEGGKGAEELAARRLGGGEQDGGHEFRLLYPDEMPLREKIETIATRVYGADGVDFAPAATKALAEYEALGYGHLPVCVAKTHLSLSHDPALKGRPTGFRFPVRDVRLAAGAGFIYPLAGDMRTMPGLPSPPGRREDRHRRRRQRRRPLLIWRPIQGSVGRGPPPRRGVRLDALMPGRRWPAKADEIGVKKAGSASCRCSSSAVLAGAFIALGAAFATTVLGRAPAGDRCRLRGDPAPRGARLLASA